MQQMQHSAVLYHRVHDHLPHHLHRQQQIGWAIERAGLVPNRRSAEVLSPTSPRSVGWILALTLRPTVKHTFVLPSFDARVSRWFTHDRNIAPLA
jgi:hypothetical protein